MLTKKICRVIYILLFALIYGSTASAIVFHSDIDQALQSYNQAKVIILFNKDQHLKTLQANSKAYKPEPDTGQSRFYGRTAPDNILAAAIASKSQNIASQINVNNGRISAVRPLKVIAGMCARIDSRALEILRQNPLVKAVYLDIPGRLPTPVESIDNKTANRSLTNSTSIIGAEIAWAKGYSGKGVCVAVLDTGVRASHEMFTGKKITEACFSTNNSEGELQSESNCPDGSDTQYGPGSAQPNTSSHGTHCAGIAVGNNKNYQEGEPRYGVAKDADLIAIQVFSYFPSENAEFSWHSDQLRALEYLYSKRNELSIGAVSMSLGGGKYETPCINNILTEIIGMLREVGIATAIATGNSSYCNEVSSPACISDALAVGATGPEDSRASYSNFNPILQDMYAPGSFIDSASIESDSAYSVKSGTSMATPHVAAAVAILKGKNGNSTVDQIETALKSTGKEIPSTTVDCEDLGNSPRIDVGKAIDEILPGPVPQNFTAFLPYINTDIAWSGLALSNLTNSQATSFQINYRNEDGQYKGSQGGEIQAQGQWVELAGVQDFEGWGEIISSQKLTGLALIGTESGAVLGQKLQYQSAFNLEAPHINTEPAQWDTILCVCNPSDSQANLIISYRNKEGQLNTTLTDIKIPAKGSARLSMQALVENVSSGTLAVESDQKIAAIVIYTHLNSDKIVGAASLELSSIDN